ncbi:hypothetical protein GP486_002567 [Trichoglossum hirsutum]|uniref:Transcriptional activator HAP2 n=1 Tax=Trichoglossum hirsutum TaxID=265104 RepID=A0A9P8RRZ8_9PEZI|nr:hypothetical protein GP486_002567 [Trichoglossum hirsutum]
MMDYAQQFHPQAPQHAQHPPHLQGAYPTTTQNSVPGGASITSPPAAQAQLHQQHTTHNQASPILPSQTHSLQQQAQNQANQLHQQISYPQAYSVGVGPQGIHPQYAVSPAQAAAMATAAASGQGYYPMTGEGGIPGNLGQEARASPVKGIKQERGQRSPPQVQGQMVGQQALPSQVQAQQQMPGRRMSQQIGSPGSQAVMNHTAGPTRSSVPPQMPPAPQPPVQQHQQSPEIVTGGAEESPLYVNAKQFHRILKRRVARQRLEEALRLTSKGRKPYLHESRHNHAMRRPRGPGGRFLTADEVAEMERQKNAEGGDHSGDKENANATQTPAKNNTHPNTSSSTGGSNKRKASAMAPDTTTPIKRSKVSENTINIGSGQPRRSSSVDESEELEEEDDGDDG